MERGLVEIETGADRRTRVVGLTSQGWEAIGRAFPPWQRA